MSEASFQTKRSLQEASTVLPLGELIFSTILNITSQCSVPRDQLQAAVSAGLLKKMASDGEKSFFLNSMLVQARDCYTLEAFFGNHISVGVADLTRKKLLTELGNEKQKKKNNGKKTNAKPQKQQVKIG